MKSFLLAGAVLLSSNLCLADWGGIFKGDAQTQDAGFDNCDIYADFFLDRYQNTFEVAHLSYSCAMSDGPTLFRSFNDVKMSFDPTTGALFLGTAQVGQLTDSILEFDLQDASFHFDQPKGTSIMNTQILDKATGREITGQL